MPPIPETPIASRLSFPSLDPDTPLQAHYEYSHRKDDRVVFSQRAIGILSDASTRNARPQRSVDPKSAARLVTPSGKTSSPPSNWLDGSPSPCKLAAITPRRPLAHSFDTILAPIAQGRSSPSFDLPLEKARNLLEEDGDAEDPPCLQVLDEKLQGEVEVEPASCDTGCGTSDSMSDICEVDEPESLSLPDLVCEVNPSPLLFDEDSTDDHLHDSMSDVSLAETELEERGLDAAKDSLAGLLPVSNLVDQPHCLESDFENLPVVDLTEDAASESDEDEREPSPTILHPESDRVASSTLSGAADDEGGFTSEQIPIVAVLDTRSAETITTGSLPSKPGSPEDRSHVVESSLHIGHASETLSDDELNSDAESDTSSLQDEVSLSALMPSSLGRVGRSGPNETDNSWNWEDEDEEENGTPHGAALLGEPNVGKDLRAVELDSTVQVEDNADMGELQSLESDLSLSPVTATFPCHEGSVDVVEAVPSEVVNVTGEVVCAVAPEDQAGDIDATSAVSSPDSDASSSNITDSETSTLIATPPRTSPNRRTALIVPAQRRTLKAPQPTSRPAPGFSAPTLSNRSKVVSKLPVLASSSDLPPRPPSASSNPGPAPSGLPRPRPTTSTAVKSVPAQVTSTVPSAAPSAVVPAPVKTPLRRAAGGAVIRAVIKPGAAPRRALAISSSSSTTLSTTQASSRGAISTQVENGPPKSPEKRKAYVVQNTGGSEADATRQALLPTSSALTAAPDRVQSSHLSNLFGASSTSAKPLRPKRARTLTEQDDTKPRTSRRALGPSAVANAPPPKVPDTSSAPLDPLDAPSSPQFVPTTPSRPPPKFAPAPIMTQDELSHLTQRNTKKNKQHFNKLDVETIHMDAARPPSPTSKIRRSVDEEGSVGRPTTKEGREARAAKRRTALRSSTDGSEIRLVQSELGTGEQEEGRLVAEAVEEKPKTHYLAPGDEEQYRSPARGRQSKTKKKSSMSQNESERRRVRWDRALVYERPLTPTGETEGIIKRIELDQFGNSLSKTTGFARATSVSIKRMIYVDDEV